MECHEKADKTLWRGFEIRDEGIDGGRGEFICLEDVVDQR